MITELTGLCSTVEANLVIICVTLPTMRRFLRHVAPKLIGESGRGHPSRDPTTDGSALQTIGSKTVRDGYGRMGDDDQDCNDSEEVISLKGGEVAAVRSAKVSENWPLEAGPATTGGIETSFKPDPPSHAYTASR